MEFVHWNPLNFSQILISFFPERRGLCFSILGEASNNTYGNDDLNVSRVSPDVRKKTIAVIPAFNEGARIERVIKDTLEYVGTVVVVNDCSSDETSAIAKMSGAVVHDLPVNKGAGYATRAGCDLAAQKGAEIIITIDADGQHDPADIPRLINVLIDEKLDIVFGYRHRNQKS